MGGGRLVAQELNGELLGLQVGAKTAVIDNVVVRYLMHTYVNGCW